MKDLKNIAVIGSGTMGNGIAHVADTSNLKTMLIDIVNNQLNIMCRIIIRDYSWYLIDYNLQYFRSYS